MSGHPPAARPRASIPKSIAAAAGGRARNRSIIWAARGEIPSNSDAQPTARPESAGWRQALGFTRE